MTYSPIHHPKTHRRLRGKILDLVVLISLPPPRREQSVILLLSLRTEALLVNILGFLRSLASAPVMLLQINTSRNLIFIIGARSTP
ncbi:hypothetical protein BDZ97DRAFT_1818893 [Flammula alnicola]|nr:hypothetical protein BDZ97DRAFT_1818893 [Flammula alnicola]